MIVLNHRYKVEEEISRGSYGIVYKGYDQKTSKYVAIKLIDNCMRSKFETINAIKEICILNSLKNTHNNIINIQDYFINGNDIILVFEYIDNTLQNLIINPSKKYNYTHIKHIMFKLLKTLEFLHDNFIIHRDIKPSNILISNLLDLKLCDFGLANYQNIFDNKKPITRHVVTRWYRAPEVILDAESYSYPIDIWALGCIFAELILALDTSRTGQLKSIFQGKYDFNLSPNPAKSEDDYSNEQMVKIIDVIGYISEEDISDMNLPEKSKIFLKKINLPCKKNNIKNLFKKLPISIKAINLLEKMLVINPKKRIRAFEAIYHDYFNDIRDLKYEYDLLCPNHQYLGNLWKQLNSDNFIISKFSENLGVSTIETPNVTNLIQNPNKKIKTC